MLTLENIRWSTPDGTPILKSIDLNIEDGKLIVITGPNGGGKTTLARVIAGIETPEEGKILLDGEDITSLDVTERAKRGISFAFQQPVRFKGITVKKLLELASNKTLTHDKLCEILSSVGLCAQDYLHREVDSTLSGGEIKRIEIASVLARESEISVFDEPEAGIDLWSFKNLIEVFQNIHKNHKGTLIIISHQERILRIADEIVLVSDGRVKEQGAADAMLQKLLRGREVVSVCHRQEELLNG